MIGRRFPGAIEYQTARTKHFDASLTKALGDGIRQLVILGAGYDTRAYRFHDELGDRQVFEVDHSATIDRKRAFLSHCAETHSTRLEHVAVDFENDDLAAELETAGYTPSCPTLFLWEGVTMFITAEAVHRTLSFVAQRSGPNTRIVFDYVNAAALSDPKPFYGGAQAARHFERSGEPWRYGIDPERPEELVGECGLTLVQHLRAQDLQERYLIDSRGRLRGRVPDFHGIITALARHPVALSR